MPKNKTVWTIGYAGYPEPADLFAVLQDKGVKLLVDVRSFPFSGIYPQYNKPAIAKLCKINGIVYRHYDKEFGARQEEPEYLSDGQVDFEKFEKSEAFLEGIKKLDKALDMGYIPCLFCAEKNPLFCHRAIMVGKWLDDNGYNVRHIIPGQISSQEDIRNSLLQMYCPNIGQISLLEECLSEDEMAAKAYRIQNKHIGWKAEES